jgi:hypothetical protein
MLPIGTKVLGMKFLKGLLTGNTKVTCDVQRSISKRSKVDLELSSILLARKYIYVPFHEKEEAKALGARWDKSARRWYIPEGREVKRFQRWLDPHTLHEVFIRPPLYIISTTCHCWKCFSPTKVSTLASFGFGGALITYGYIEGGNFELEDVLLTPHLGFEKRYSRTLKSAYFTVPCKECNSIQGDNFIIFDSDAPLTPLFSSEGMILEHIIREPVWVSATYSANSESPLIPALSQYI